MSRISYFFKLVFFGEHPVIMIILASIVIVAACRNCYGTKVTDQVLVNHRDSFFVIWSAIAGVFHTGDLLVSWALGDIVLSASKSTGESIVLALAFGLAIAGILISVAFGICKMRAERIEKQAFRRRLKKLGR